MRNLPRKQGSGGFGFLTELHRFGLYTLAFSSLPSTYGLFNSSLNLAIKLNRRAVKLTNQVFLKQKLRISPFVRSPTVCVFDPFDMDGCFGSDFPASLNRSPLG
jgi:hypothetical protein